MKHVLELQFSIGITVIKFNKIYFEVVSNNYQINISYNNILSQNLSVRIFLIFFCTHRNFNILPFLYYMLSIL